MCTLKYVEPHVVADEPQGLQLLFQLLPLAARLEPEDGEQDEPGKRRRRPSRKNGDPDRSSCFLVHRKPIEMAIVNNHLGCGFFDFSPSNCQSRNIASKASPAPQIGASEVNPQVTSPSVKPPGLITWEPRPKPCSCHRIAAKRQGGGQTAPAPGPVHAPGKPKSLPPSSTWRGSWRS